MQTRTAALLVGLVMALAACADESRTPIAPETISGPRSTHTSLTCPAFHNTGGSTYAGVLSGAGDYDIQPCGTYFTSLANGTHTGVLDGSYGTDFDLYLYKWIGSSWTLVAYSAGSSSWEQVSYTGTGGDYFWEVYSYSGAGNYTFTMSHPKVVCTPSPCPPGID